jgi:glycopeptide antibiotics resistance protein
VAQQQVRVVRVRKWITFILLLLVSAAIVLLAFALSGKAYARETEQPLGGVSQLARTVAGGRYTSAQLLALAMPALANALVFVPWGFLMFIWLDRPSRPVFVSYATTWAVGMTFALALSLWQFALPTRVTDVSDAIWNSVGAFGGALVGQIRKRVRVAFE